MKVGLTVRCKCNHSKCNSIATEILIAAYTTVNGKTNKSVGYYCKNCNNIATELLEESSIRFETATLFQD